MRSSILARIPGYGLSQSLTFLPENWRLGGMRLGAEQRKIYLCLLVKRLKLSVDKKARLCLCLQALHHLKSSRHKQNQPPEVLWIVVYNHRWDQCYNHGFLPGSFWVEAIGPICPQFCRLSTICHIGIIWLEATVEDGQLQKSEPKFQNVNQM